MAQLRAGFVLALLVLAFSGCGGGDSVGLARTATSGGRGSETETEILPTPDAQGGYANLTFEQAQAIVPFLLSLPANVPAELGAPQISVSTAPTGSGGEGNYVTAMLFQVHGSGETGNQSDDPLEGGIVFVQSLGVFDPSAIASDASTTIREINGAPVNRTTGTYRSGSPIVIYWWERDGVERNVAAVLQGDVTERLVEEFVGGIIQR
jgi:hypothetical protein